MMDCKRALEEAGGDLEKAVDVLRKKGAAKADTRAGREASEGLVEAYIHFNGRVGVLVEVNCETDFVARTEDFKQLVRDVALHIASARPLAVRVEDLPPELVERERKIYEAQAAEEKKPDAVKAKIVEGRVKKFFEEAALLEQKFVKDDTRTVGDLVKAVAGAGVKLGLGVGGGNILGGPAAGEQGMDRGSPGYMGMLATGINAPAVQDILEKKGVDTRVMAAIRMEELAEPNIRRRAVRHLEKGRMVIFAGGTGNPYFSTDTAAVLRALEIEANVLLKATNVGGVYTADPKKDPKAKLLPELSFRDALVNGYAVMDAKAFGLCKEKKLPIVVFNIKQPRATARVLAGERVGTIVQ